jgi:hypothetical protein
MSDKLLIDWFLRLLMPDFSSTTWIPHPTMSKYWLLRSLKVIDSHMARALV